MAYFSYFSWTAVRFGRVPKRSKSMEESQVTSSDPTLDPTSLESKQLAIYDIILNVSQAHLANCGTTDDKLKTLQRHHSTLVTACLYSTLVTACFHSTLVTACFHSTLVTTWFSLVFSSPEHKVLKVSYCDRPLSVVVRRASSVVRRA